VVDPSTTTADRAVDLEEDPGAGNNKIFETRGVLQLWHGLGAQFPEKVDMFVEVCLPKISGLEMNWRLGLLSGDQMKLKLLFHGTCNPLLDRG
jgi:hypothetical protein